MIPLIDLNKCEYEPKLGQLKLASEYAGIPNAIRIHSHHTGRTVLFRPIMENHPMFDQDNWDGEQQIYEPVDVLKNVQTLVIYHQY